MGLSYTVSGDIASFRTPSRVPIESLKFHFLPKQAAGTPSPENPIPIEGWTGLNGRQEGKNLIDLNALTGDNKVWWKGSVVSGYPNHCVTPKIPVKPGVAYRLNRNSGQHGYLCYFDKNGDYVDQKTWDDYTPSRVIPDNVYFVGITIGTQYLDNPKPSFTVGSQATEYSDYVEPRQIPITFPDGETIYGGYIDPVAGEIVAEYYLARAKKTDFGNKSTPSGTGRDYRQTQSIFPKTDSGVEWAIARQQQKFNRGIIANPWSEASYGENIGVIVTQDSMNPVITYMRISEEVYQAMSDDDYAEISYKLREPIHIPIPAEDMKAFLDHNNFWSDANDITEVTYAVTESKAMLDARKKAMDFDMGHHKKVKWNQLAKPINAENWKVYSENKASVSFDDDIVTRTTIDTTSQRYTVSVVTKYYFSEYKDHYYYVNYDVYHEGQEGSYAYFVNIVGNTWTAQTKVYSNTWTTLKNIKQAPSGSLTRMMFICYTSSDNIPIGDVTKGRKPILIDLTVMFGAGNEPTTVAEFEHICDLNGIDLTTYQPYDSGSDRWLIIP